MAQPKWVYYTMAFGLVGIIMLIKFIKDLPKINILFLFGGVGFCLVFIVGVLRVLKEVKELDELQGGKKIR